MERRVITRVGKTSAIARTRPLLILSVVVALVIIAVAAAATITYINTTQKTTTSSSVDSSISSSCTEGSNNNNENIESSPYNGTTTGDYFVVRVDYNGSWMGVITTYSALERNSSYLHSVVCISGTGKSVTIVVPAWNVNGEESTWISATKLDSSNGNLTVSVGYGSFVWTNSTTDPDGTALAWVGITP
jgi:hypothetical protein